MSFRPEALSTRIQEHLGLRLPERWCVALSAGLDSTVALHALSRILERENGQQLRALHVHHGLYPDAEAWTGAARANARAVACPFEVLRVSVQRSGGQSLEDCARRARYQAIAEALLPGEILVTGHHQDDQLETVMLQLMRGAGVAGLAAMPLMAKLGPGHHYRPLLEFSREELLAWAQSERLEWIEEPSNQDLGFDRNYLRHMVLPLLKQRWPAAARAASRSARYCAQAQGLLTQMAAEDLKNCASGEELRVPALLALDSARLANVLRHWVPLRGLPTPPAHVLELVRGQVLEAREQALPRLAWKGGEFRRYRDRLFALDAVPASPAGSIQWSGDAPLDLPHGLGQLSLVAGQGTGLEPGPGPGMDAAALRGGQLDIRFRQGGERLCLAGRQGSRGLRELFQEYGVLPWVRGRIPMLYVDGRLAAVGALWVDQAFAAIEGQPALSLHWDGAPRLLL
jgi:tRNA(Ile)-lysidine synthase